MITPLLCMTSAIVLRGVAFFVHDAEVLAAARYRHSTTFNGLKFVRAATLLDVLVEYRKVQLTRHDVIGQKS